MKKGSMRVTAHATTAVHVHARTTNDAGRVAPLCGAYRASQRVNDLVVTKSRDRVTCPRCKEG